MLSDLHSDIAVIPKFKGIIASQHVATLAVCGDVTHYGDFTKAKEMLKELTHLSIPVLFVPGNCDPKELITSHSVYGATNLHENHAEIGGLHFIGIGGSPSGPFNTPFEMSENEMKRMLDKTHKNLNLQNPFVLISHTPPMGTKVDVLRSGVHAGSHAIREFVITKKPRLVLCGHIHEAIGKDLLDGTVVVNPGPAHMGRYALVDINEELEVVFDVFK